jgi:hypothetical protein
LAGVEADLSIKIALTTGEYVDLNPVRALLGSNVIAKTESLNCFRLSTGTVTIGAVKFY